MRYIDKCGLPFDKCGVIHVLMHLKDTLKEELAWTTDKWLQVISNITLLKTGIPVRN